MQSVQLVGISHDRVNCFDLVFGCCGLQEALKSKASAPTGQKVFNMPLTNTFVHDMRRGASSSGGELLESI